MSPRALVLRSADYLADGTRDAYIARAIGLVLAGALILGWAALRFLDAIGA